MGKNVAIAFPDTYQEHLLPLSTAVHSYADQCQPVRAAWEAPHCGPWLRRTLADSFREKNAKHAVPLARIAMTGSSGPWRWISRSLGCDPLEEYALCSEVLLCRFPGFPFPAESFHYICSTHSGASVPLMAEDLGKGGASAQAFTPMPVCR